MKVVVDVDRLIALLADRLAGIVPDGFRIDADHAMLRFSAEAGRFPGQSGTYHVGPSASHVRQYFEVLPGTVADRLVGVGVRVLDDLQDYVSEATHDPWPGRTAQPTPQGELREGQLHLWYGGRHGRQAVLACAPIALTDLGPAQPGRHGRQ
ncbi:MAG TPA: hypothetical protein VGI21_18185 [Streptosporangiaceae bacterium]